nr:phage tail tape measure protein [Flaviflexus equikiangi]
MNAASKSLDKLVKDSDKYSTTATTGLGRMVQSMDLQREQWAQAGTALTAFGVGSAAALGASAKAAVDWESSFAGVLKTVDGSVVELSALEEGLRGMARELPASHAEIASVAEAAGQLGIETANVQGFTQVMIDMGESTSMSAEEAATQLARFVNIMGSSQTEFSNIGSAVVALGNSFATTEGEIVAMSMRLAGAGAQLGLSEADVLGLATAMSSLGIESEAGGTAMSQTMIQMRNAIDDGGESLEAFATAAGMSSDEFSKLFRESPADAILAVVTGLGELEAQGVNTSSILEDIGATGLRQADALRRLSGDATILGDAFQMANGAYAENTALAEEAAQRYETVASQLKMAKNAVVDAAISFGQVLLPAVSGAAEGVQAFASFVADLPAPLQAVAGGLGITTTAVALAGGGFLLLAPRIYDTVIAFQALRGVNFMQMAGGLTGIAGAVGKFGAIGAGIAAIALVADSVTGINQMNVVAVEDMADALTAMGTSATTTNDALSKLFTSKHALPWRKKDIDSFADALDHLESRFQSLFGDGFGDKFDRVTDPGKFERITAEISHFDEAWAQMANSGNADIAAEQYAQMVDLMINSGASVAEATGYFQTYQKAVFDAGEALPGVIANWEEMRALMGGGAPIQLPDGSTVWNFAEGMDAAAQATTELTAAAEGLGISEEAMIGIYDSQVRSLQEIIDKRRQLAGEAMSQLDLERNRWEIMEGLTEAAEHQDVAFDKLAGTFNVTNDAGWNAHQMSEAWTQAMWDEAEAMRGRGEEYPAIMARMEEMRAEYENQIAGLQGVGDKAGEVADSYEMIPEDIATRMFLETAPATQELNGMLLEIDQASGEITINGRTVDAQESLAELLGLIADRDGMVDINGNSYPAEMTLADWLLDANGQEAIPDISADDDPARRILNALMGDVDIAYEEVTLGGDDVQGRSILSRLMGDVGRSREDVTISGDDSVGRGVLTAFGSRIRSTREDVTVGANTSLGESLFAGMLNRMRGRSVTVGVGIRGAALYADGGYTGPGGKWEPAGIVHRGEVVWSQDDIARAGGVDVVEAMRLGLRGYAGGGYVSATPSRPVVNVAAPSLEGMQLTGSLRIGDSLHEIVDGRIEAAQRKQRIVARRP